MKRDWLALFITYIGIAAVVAHDLHVGTLDRNVLIGSSWVLASSICYAIYIVGIGQMGHHIGNIRLAAYASLFSAAYIVAHGLLNGVWHTLLTQPTIVYIYGGVMALIATVLPVLLTVIGIRKIGAAHAAMLSSIGPVITIFFGWLILDEVVGLIQIAGAALVVAGVLLITLKPKKPKLEPQ